MNRSYLSLSALLVCCCTATAQAPDPVATPATPPITSTQATTVAQFQKIEDAWSDSVNKRDQYGLELVLSPLLVDISASGDVTTLNQQVVQLINGDDKTLDLTQKVITVRMLGDAAVVNGTYTLHHRVSGQPVDEKGVFTHVFQLAHGTWRCVNSQRTVLSADASAKQKQKQKKQTSTTADEPFHIPFFSK